MGEEFVDLVDGMIVDPGNDIFTPHPGINTVHLTGSDEAVDFCQALGTQMTACKQEVLSSYIM
jgi:hypothetical protein